MTTAILRLIWPYVARQLLNRGAEYSAGFLHARRERRLAQQIEPEIIETSPPEVLEETVLTEVACPPPPRFLAGDAFWFTLSGIFLGGAFGVIIAYLVKQND